MLTVRREFIGSVKLYTTMREAVDVAKDSVDIVEDKGNVVEKRDVGKVKGTKNCVYFIL